MGIPFCAPRVELVVHATSYGHLTTVRRVQATQRAKMCAECLNDGGVPTYFQMCGLPRETTTHALIRVYVNHGMLSGTITKQACVKHGGVIGIVARRIWLASSLTYRMLE
jgi:hypothetical protein